MMGLSACLVAVGTLFGLNRCNKIKSVNKIFSYKEWDNSYIKNGRLLLPFLAWRNEE